MAATEPHREPKIVVQKYDYIDALRGYAIFLVILSHVGTSFPLLPYPDDILGVPCRPGTSPGDPLFRSPGVSDRAHGLDGGGLVFLAGAARRALLPGYFVNDPDLHPCSRCWRSFS